MPPKNCRQAVMKTVLIPLYRFHEKYRKINFENFKSTRTRIKQKIPETQIWIGYKEIPMNANDEMNRVFEEIISRNIKPGLTKKPN